MSLEHLTGAHGICPLSVTYQQSMNKHVPASGLYRIKEIEIAVVTAGAGVLFVAESEFPCQAGDIFIIAPDVPHGFSGTAEAPLTMRRLSFAPEEWLEGEWALYGTPRFCYGAFSDGARIAYAALNEKMRRGTEHLLNAICREAEEQQEEWRDAVRAHLSLLLIDVGRYVKSAIKTGPALPQWEQGVVTAALHEAATSYADSTLTLEVIADRLFISRSHLSAQIKQLTGESFSDHLRRLRLERACELLRETDMTVADIMQACGLRDTPSFYKNFNVYTGMTPHQYKTVNTQNIEKRKKGELIMSIFNDISENLQRGKSKIVKELVEKALAEGCSPADVLQEGLLSGMAIIGEKFKNNEIYVPEVLVAARAMNMGAQVLKPHLAAEGVAAKGKVCIGTVQGDLHDIGKNLVKMMMEGKGLEVIDLGTDVAPEAFVKTAIDEGCQVICCSALLTTTMGVMGDVVKAAEAAGVRDKIKIMIGGAPINEEFCREIGADCYTVDAASAADAAVALCQG